MTTEKHTELLLPTLELNRLMSNTDIQEDEFNARTYRLLGDFHDLTARQTKTELLFCFPKPPVNFLRKNDPPPRLLQEVYLYHGSSEVALRTQNRLSSYSSRILRGIVKITFDGQTGFVFATNTIEIGKSEAIFAPPEHKPIIHSYTYQ